MDSTMPSVGQFKSSGFFPPSGGTAGQVLTATGTSGSFAWTSLATGLVPSNLSGYWYEPWRTRCNNNNFGTRSLAANACMYAPVFVPAPVTISALGTCISTAGTGLIYLAVANMIPAPIPVVGRILMMGSAPATATGGVAVTAPSGFTLPRGWLWFCAGANSATTLYSLNSNFPDVSRTPFGLSGLVTSPPPPAYTETQNLGVPRTGAPLVGTVHPPFIMYRVA